MLGYVLLMLLAAGAVLLAFCLLLRSATILVGQIRRKELLSFQHVHIAALVASIVAMCVCYNNYCFAWLSQTGKTSVWMTSLLTFVVLVVLPYSALIAYRFYQGLRPDTFSPSQEVRVLADQKGVRDAVLVTVCVLALLGVAIVAPHVPRTTLLQAAKSHNTLLVACLLALGADPNVRGGSSLTPLQFACRNNDLEMVRLLLANSADLNYPSSIGQLELASRHKDLNIFTLLLEQGADVNARTTGTTALAAVAREGCPAAVRMLLERGADVNATNLTQRTALMEACAAGNTHAVEVLLEYGADVNAVSLMGDTALICSCWWKAKPEIVKALLDKGADVTARQSTGKTALMLIKKGRSPEVHALLAAATSAANARADHDDTSKSPAEKRKPAD